MTDPGAEALAPFLYLRLLPRPLPPPPPRFTYLFIYLPYLNHGAWAAAAGRIPLPLLAVVPLPPLSPGEGQRQAAGR